MNVTRNVNIDEIKFLSRIRYKILINFPTVYLQNNIKIFQKKYNWLELYTGYQYHILGHNSDDRNINFLFASGYKIFFSHPLFQSNCILNAPNTSFTHFHNPLLLRKHIENERNERKWLKNAQKSSLHFKCLSSFNFLFVPQSKLHLNHLFSSLNSKYS